MTHEERETVAETTERFNKDLAAYGTAGLAKERRLELGRAGSLLRSAGFPGDPIILPQRVLAKAAHKHGIPYAAFRDLPAKVQEPVAVFESSTEPGHRVVLTDIQAGGKSIVAAVHLHRRLGAMEVSEICSLHGSGREIEAWASKGLLRLVDQERGGRLLDRQPPQHSGMSSNRPSNNIVVYTTGEVNLKTTEGGPSNPSILIQKKAPGAETETRQ